MNLIDALRLLFRKKSSANDISNIYNIPEHFDDRQKSIICLDNGYHLVLAPAGCGKTDILAERVCRALNMGVNVDDMMCLTFTNRASRGMRTRVKSLLGDRVNSLFIGNTHRFCSKFIFEHNIVNQSSAIIDEDDVLSIINSFSNNDTNVDAASLSYEDRSRFTAVVQLQHLMQQYRLGHSKDIMLSREYGYVDNGASVMFYSSQLFVLLCQTVGKPVSIESILEFYDNAGGIDESIRYPVELQELIDIIPVAKQYEIYKESEGLLDFDDLLIMTYEYARHNSDKIKKYRWIQIDEVQDLNPLQFAIVDLFTDCDNNVTIYLGDEQQAIFSFIGAQLETLGLLKQKCGSNIHHLEWCYRSPKYLLDIFNHYAHHQLNTDSDFLPRSSNNDVPKTGSLRVHYSESNETAYADAANYAKNSRNGRTAIIVPSNNDANKVSQALSDIPHFKMSGTDLFAQKEIKLLISHLNVINSDINFIAWSRILWVLGLFNNYSESRKFVLELRNVGLNLSDFIHYDRSSYLLEFSKAYESSQPIVIFDTETTGLDIFSDEIVQIAALKIIAGKVVDQLDLILHTDRAIPEFLGEIINPLVNEYAQREHLTRKDGLSKFFEFAEGCVLIGHNVEYDYNILVNNCKRDAPELLVEKEFPLYFDTLKIARLLRPKLRSYKLRDLLIEFDLQGENTHLADDDIIATKSVVDYCYEHIGHKKEEMMSKIDTYYDLSQQFRSLYGKHYLRAKHILFKQIDTDTPIIVTELQNLYSDLLRRDLIRPVNKFKYICNYLTLAVVNVNAERSLYEQLNNHIMNINTFREADLCDDSVKENIIKEKIFISTVHKAKGLEFDNVLVFGCINDVYPFYATANNPISCQEDARKLYVAMSRAKQRLCFLSYRRKEGVSRMGNRYSYPAEISPFLMPILEKFKFEITYD